MASNTTIGLVATDAVLNHEDLQRLAMMGQDGYACAIRPVHTPFDGDTLFAISTEAEACSRYQAHMVGLPGNVTEP